MSKFYIILLLLIASSALAMRKDFPNNNGQNSQNLRKTVALNQQQRITTISRTHLFDQLPIMTQIEENINNKIDEIKNIYEIGIIRDTLIYTRGKLICARVKLDREFCDDLDENTLNNLVSKFGTFYKSDIVTLAKELNSQGSKRWLTKNGEPYGAHI